MTIDASGSVDRQHSVTWASFFAATPFKDIPAAHLSAIRSVLYSRVSNKVATQPPEEWYDAVAVDVYNALPSIDNVSRDDILYVLDNDPDVRYPIDLYTAYHGNVYLK